jgi:hypothetical protein
MQDHNPFAGRLAKAQDRLRRLEVRIEHQRQSDLPGSFVTGRSGQKSAYRRKLDRQMERTIELAVALEQARRQVRWLQASYDAYAAGTINAQGRSVAAKSQRTRREGERLFVGVYSTGLMYCDRWREDGGDYAEIAFLPYSTLHLERRKGYSGAPASLIAAVEAHAADVQAQRGQPFAISACGQTVILGQR